MAREKLPPGFKRNALGGLVAPEPGGYEREWGDLMGVGIYPWPRPKRLPPDSRGESEPPPPLELVGGSMMPTTSELRDEYDRQVKGAERELGRHIGPYKCCDECGHMDWQHVPPTGDRKRVNICDGRPPPASDLYRCNCSGFRHM